jgi:hypothetical protein
VFQGGPWGAQFAYLENDKEHFSAQSEYDTGHEFDTISRSLICTPTLDHKWSSGSTEYHYAGPLVADIPTYGAYGAWPSPPSSVNAAYYGPAAIAACAPTHPLVSLAVDLAEFKSEGARITGAALLKHAERGKSLTPVKYPTKRFGKRRANGKRVLVPGTSGFDRSPISTGATTAAEEYLNWQFGLNPILRDSRTVLENILDSEDLLEQYRRNSGKLQHRSFRFPLQRTTIYDGAPTIGGVAPSSASSYMQSFGFAPGGRFGSWKESVVQTTDIWFRGAFTYYLPPDTKGVDIARREQEFNYLFGTRVTPEVLWNLQPWSWFIDWNVNIGQNIANAERLSSDGLVMKYGYLMCTQTIDHTVTVGNVRLNDGTSRPCTTIFRIQRKQRVKASPFGFSLNPSSFSARQWAILGSLGYTKAPQSLKTL